jgi:LmbE family N-acetylglucosaminyl deacetylase
MFELLLSSRQTLNVLCLGAHSDDIEIGCGGTILTLLYGGVTARIHWIVFSSDKTRAREARNSANQFLTKADKKEIILHQYRDGFLSYAGSRIKSEFEKAKNRFDPDLIFTHYRDDRHQDHRLISDLTWNTWRDHLILEYEIPKYDGDLGIPNFFIPLEKDILNEKINLIVQSFRSQQVKNWFESATFKGLARLRGMECNAPTKYAEAFFCRKLLLGQMGYKARRSK